MSGRAARARAIARRAGLVLAGLVAFAGTFEATIRALHPTPRAQIVRAAFFQPPGGSFGLDPHGVVLWHPMDADSHAGPPCDVPGHNVLLVGSSILYGSGVAADEVVSTYLAARLGDDGQAWCVRNEAAGAYGADQKLGALRRALATFRADVVVWEIWENDVARFVLLDGDGVNTGLLRTDDDGYPRPLPLPASLGQALWRHSAGWRFLALAVTPVDEGAFVRRGEEVATKTVPAAIAAIRAAGATPIALVATRLDRPFAESARLSRELPDLGARQRLAFEAEGVPVLAMAELFADRAPADVALDPCCHLSPAGHATLAEALTPHVRAAVAARVTTAAPP